MEKEFIPYEQALALKELGFDEPCLASWTYKTKQRIPTLYGCGALLFDTDGLITNQTEDVICSAPLYQQAFRWFREKYNLFHEIHIDKIAEPKFCFDIFQYEHFGNYDEIRIGEYYLYRTQEEAELECLKELIEIVNG